MFPDALHAVANAIIHFTGVKLIMGTKTITTTATGKSQVESNQDWLLRTVAREHRTWIKRNPNATLGDLLTHLNVVEDELLSFDEEEVLVEILDELIAAAEYLSDWTPVNEPIDGDLPTVGYRLLNIEEDIGCVEELIDEVGEDYSLKRVRKPKRRT